MRGLGQVAAARMRAATAATATTEALFTRAMAATGMTEKQLKAVMGAVAVQAARSAQSRARLSTAAMRLALGNSAARAAVAEFLGILAAGAGASVAAAATPSSGASGFGSYFRS